MQENTDQNNSKYGHFLRSESLHFQFIISNLNETNDEKFLYLVGSVLQS